MVLLIRGATRLPSSMSPLEATLSVWPSVTSVLEPGTREWEPISMALEEGAWCAVRSAEPRVRTVGSWAVGVGLVKVAVVPSKTMAFDAVDSVWLSITIIEVSLSRSWLPTCNIPLGNWTAVMVIEPRSRTASGRVDCADNDDFARPPCEVKEVLVGLIVSLQPSLSGTV